MALYGSAAAALAAPAADGTAALAAATVGARRPGRGPADGDGGGAAAELSPGSLAALPLPLAVVCRSLVRLPALARHLVMHAGRPKANSWQRAWCRPLGLGEVGAVFWQRYCVQTAFAGAV